MDYKESLLAHYPEPLVEAILSAQQGKSTHCLVLNEDKMEASSLLEIYPHLRAHPFIPNAFYYDKDEYDLGKSYLHDVGAFYIQDAAAMVPSFLLDPKPGDTVLDYSAAPGGKTIDAALLMKGVGAILSNDISYPRMLEESKNIERMGIASAVLISSDLAKSGECLYGRFDKVILDAPCSGSAMFRKQKEMEEDWTYEKVLSLAKLQKELLDLAYRYLKKGGTLVYSTCSFSYEEDEGVILDFLNNHDGASLIEVEDRPGFYHHPDLKEGIHLFPHLYEGEGQFICLIRKDEEEEIKRCKPIGDDRGALLALKKIGVTPGQDKVAIQNKGAAYLLPRELAFVDLWKLGVVRPGLKVLEESPKGDIEPDLHFARSGNAPEAIELAKEQAEAYLRGETFRLEGPNGYRTVSYNGLVLGYVKLVNGTAKNHYPKGLRHKYSL